MLTVTEVPARSAAITRDNASTAAPAGPYGTKPRRTIVCSFIETLTIRPPPSWSISGTTSRAIRKQPPSLVSTTSRNPAGGTSQNGCGSDMNRGLTVRMPMPALFTSMSMPPQASRA